MLEHFELLQVAHGSIPVEKVPARQVEQVPVDNEKPKPGKLLKKEERKC